MLVARGLSAAPPGSAPVVRGFDLQLEPGRWIAVTGPNGAGKSTLLLTLAGLWPAAAGTVALDGVALGPGAAAARARIAVVLQDPAGQILRDTVADEIAMAALNLGHPESEVAGRVAAWSARFGLTADLGADPRTLSAGRQQMVLLAAALAARPALLLSDEGGAHLDGAARRVALAVLREEVTKGLSVVWVTQEDEEIAAADRTLELAADRPIAPPAGGSAVVTPRLPVVPDGAGLARVTVTPWDGGGGRVVRVTGPLGLDIGTRGVTAVEGPNGAGKSVLLEAIAGVSELTQVRVAWNGRLLHPPILAAQYPEQQIFAERVDEEVLFAVRARGGDAAAGRAAAVVHFEALGLGGAAFLERRTWDLSAAEKRMVQVVAALVAPADLVLLDEPTCGLDPHRRRRLGGLVATRSGRGPIVVAGQDSEWHREVGAARLELGKRGASVDVKTD